MYRRTLVCLLGALVVVMLAAAGARADSVSVVTTVGGLSANDMIAWSQLGADATVLTASSSFTSTNGLSGSAVLTGPNSLVAVVCPEALCSWNPLSNTGFSTGDSLIWTADAGSSGNGPLTVNFSSKNVKAAGAFVQADGPGQFTAQIEAFDGATSLGTFPIESDSAGDATFIGVIDNTAANITSVQFSITSCNGDCSDFAIDTVSLNAPVGGPTSTPTMTPTGGPTPTPTMTPTGGPTPTATQTATPTPTPTAVPGTLRITPPSKNFGKVKVGKFKKETFTLTNTAKSGPPISFGSPLATVTNFPIFGFPAMGATTCGPQLPPKKKCKLHVLFEPQSTGPAPASAMMVNDNAAGAPQMVPLSGTGK